MIGLWRKIEIYCKAIVNISIFCAGILALVYFAPKALQFFMPFVIGGIIAAISYPLVRFFEKKLKIRRKTGTAVVIVIVIALVIILGYLLISWITRQTIDFLAQWPTMWENIQGEFLAIGDRINLLIERLPLDTQNTLLVFQDNMSKWLGEMVSTISTPTFHAVSGFFKNLPSIIVGIVMCLLAAYFFIAEREFMTVVLPQYIPRGITEKWRLVIGSIKSAVGGYFKAQLKIEIWVYLLMVVGFFLLKVDYAILIALGIAALDFLPIFGTGTVLIPWALIKLINGEYVTFIGILVIWGVGQLVRQIIQPKIMGDTIGVSPIPTLFLLYIGYRTRGVLGMIIALPIGIIVINLYQAGVFETARNSVRILFDGINRFRQLNPSDLSEKELRMLESRRRLEETRKIEGIRKTEEARKTEGIRKAEEARKTEEVRKAEETRKTEEVRKAEKIRKTEEAQKTDKSRKSGGSRPSK